VTAQVQVPGIAPFVDDCLGYSRAHRLSFFFRSFIAFTVPCTAFSESK